MSLLEAKMRRLLARCELVAKKNRSDPTIHKSIESIEEMLIELEKSENKPSNVSLLEYNRRLEKLKDQFPVKSSQKLSLHESFSSNIEYHPYDIPRYKSDRDELLNLDRDNSTFTTSDEVDGLLKYHNDIQTKITTEMLTLTTNLKEQSKLAGTIIRKDTEILKKSGQVSEDNFSKLKVESEKLQDHSKRACKCWMWMMILIVLAVFISMVVFMKVMKKKNK